MPWLADRGYRVFGVELSPLAVEQFFESLDPRFRGDDGIVVTHTPKGVLAEAGPIALLCGDVFALDAQDLVACTAVFDRAALIALPPDCARVTRAKCTRRCRAAASGCWSRSNIRRTKSRVRRFGARAGSARVVRTGVADRSPRAARHPVVPAGHPGPGRDSTCTPWPIA
jgi:hypothetical protein